MAKEKLLELKNLKTYFYTDEGISQAVDGVDFEIYPGETLGIVGESGSGKSVTSLSVMRLIPDPPGKIVDGEILFKGKDLSKVKLSKMQDIRGNEISMIFQEPMTSLNPVYTIGDQISETIIIHQNVNKKEAKIRAIEMLKKVGIPLPEQRVNEYPHQLSGGMRQRVMIAMALSCNPKLLIADEPTTALDVTIQAQILDLMNDLKKNLNMAIMMITHDLGVIAEVADRVVVMYAGKVVEYTDVKTLFKNPAHPYTWGLLNSIPRLDKEVDRLTAIPGVVPSALEFPGGCRYNTRCPLAKEKCFTDEPPLSDYSEGHKTRCWYPEEIKTLNIEKEKSEKNIEEKNTAKR
ncbi:MAG: ABC transporter ATP-binding protein [Bacillota bacterium]